MLKDAISILSGLESQGSRLRVRDTKASWMRAGNREKKGTNDITKPKSSAQLAPTPPTLAREQSPIEDLLSKILVAVVVLPTPRSFLRRGFCCPRLQAPDIWKVSTYGTRRTHGHNFPQPIMRVRRANSQDPRFLRKHNRSSNHA